MDGPRAASAWRGLPWGDRGGPDRHGAGPRPPSSSARLRLQFETRIAARWRRAGPWARSTFEALASKQGRPASGPRGRPCSRLHLKRRPMASPLSLHVWSGATASGATESTGTTRGRGKESRGRARDIAGGPSGDGPPANGASLRPVGRSAANPHTEGVCLSDSNDGRSASVQPLYGVVTGPAYWLRPPRRRTPGPSAPPPGRRPPRSPPPSRPSPPSCCRAGSAASVPSWPRRPGRLGARS